ncbi:MAG: SocA family protein [Acidobacteria bacterium]|nr:SocA family protein [Acidobacteriota bacterium]
MTSGDRKFKELILYLARKSEGDVHFGATKLNKQLFYADFIAYRQLGSSISGQRYQKLPYGPAPRGLKPVVSEMLEEGCCAEAARSHHGYEQRRLLALREPDVSVFDARELELIHQVVEELKDRSAREVSDLSHEFIGWQLADEKEDIPYEAALISFPEPLSEAEIQYGLELAAERDEQPKVHSA